MFHPGVAYEITKYVETQFCDETALFTIVLVFKSLQCRSLQYDALFLALFHWIFGSSSIDLTNQVEEYHIAAEAAL